MSITIDEIRSLPVGQRVQLVEDIWDTLASECAEIELSEAQMSDMESRRAQMLADPSVGVPWELAKASLSGKS